MTAASYQETYRLKIPPFGSDIDDRFFYGGSALMQRLDLLTHLTQFGESVILVCGPTGSGKSTLLRHYISHAAAQWRICALHAHAFDRFASLLADVLNTESGHNELELLEQWAAGSDASQLLVVVIDDADQLDDKAFQRLDALLQHPYHDRVRVLLFGTQRLNQNVQDAQNRQVMSSTSQPLEIPKLTEEETASYLMYRLAVAGYSGESPFTATEIRAMCKAGEGRPGDINKLAHQALEEHQARVKTRKTPHQQVPKKYRTGLWATASVAAIALAAYLGWQRMEPADGIDTATRTAQLSNEETPLSLPPDHQTTPQDAIDDVAGLEEPPATSAGESADIATILPATRIAAEPSTTGIDEPVATAVTLPQEEKQADAIDTEAEIQTATTAVEEVVQVVELEEQPMPVPEPAPSGPMEQADLAPPADTRQPAETQPSVTKTGGPYHEGWLLEQDSASFSLQLLGSRSEQALSSFIRKHNLDTGKTAYYQGIHQGKPWYVLMYGNYPSRKTAVEAVSELPSAVRKGKPWPREMKSVQKAIDTRS